MSSNDEAVAAEIVPQTSTQIPAAPKRKGQAKRVAKKKVVRKTAIKHDQFGFVAGSLKSKAAVMFASKRGATLHEVKNKLNSTQFNLLTELKAKGFKIQRVTEKGKDSMRGVTRYFLAPK